MNTIKDFISGMNSDLNSCVAQVQKDPIVIRDPLDRPTLIIDDDAVKYDSGYYDCMNGFTCTNTNRHYIDGYSDRYQQEQIEGRS